MGELTEFFNKFQKFTLLGKSTGCMQKNKQVKNLFLICPEIIKYLLVR